MHTHTATPLHSQSARDVSWMELWMGNVRDPEQTPT
jgi:hypothetical protein